MTLWCDSARFSLRPPTRPENPHAPMIMHFLRFLSESGTVRAAAF